MKNWKAARFWAWEVTGGSDSGSQGHILTPPIGISGMDKVEAHKAVTFQAVNLEEACRSVFHQEGRGGLGLLSGSGTVLYLF